MSDVELKRYVPARSTVVSETPATAAGRGLSRGNGGDATAPIGVGLVERTAADKPFAASILITLRNIGLCVGALVRWHAPRVAKASFVSKHHQVIKS
jgi:hypothetical protein